MREILVLFLRKITEILPYSSDLSPSQQSSSSGDLLPEMMESGTPPLPYRLTRRAILRYRHGGFL